MEEMQKETPCIAARKTEGARKSLEVGDPALPHAQKGLDAGDPALPRTTVDQSEQAEVETETAKSVDQSEQAEVKMEEQFDQPEHTETEYQWENYNSEYEPAMIEDLEDI